MKLSRDLDVSSDRLFSSETLSNRLNILSLTKEENFLLKDNSFNEKLDSFSEYKGLSSLNYGNECIRCGKLFSEDSYKEHKDYSYSFKLMLLKMELIDIKELCSECEEQMNENYGEKGNDMPIYWFFKRRYFEKEDNLKLTDSFLKKEDVLINRNTEESLYADIRQKYVKQALSKKINIWN